MEEEREKLLNSGLKESRPIVSTSDDLDRPRSSSANSAKINGSNPSDKSVKESPPSGGNVPARPFMYTPPAGGPQFPLWSIPGMFPGAHNLFNREDRNNRESSGQRDRNEREEEQQRRDRDGANAAENKDSSPGPKDGSKRIKTASGSAGSNSSKESGLGSLPPLIANDQANVSGQNLVSIKFNN